MPLKWITPIAAALALAAPAALAQTEEELAKQLANPIADLISVPFQNNFDFGGGSDDDAFRYTLNIQPVVPISLTEDWNVISRTILPIVYQDEVLAPDSDEFGLSDTTQSLFFSPVVGPGDLIWGVGPVLFLPTATDDALGREKWGAGPTGVALQQRGPWTVGMLANHIWSFAGEDDRADVNATFLQPFVAYAWPFGFTVTANTESTYDWEDEEWTVPLNLLATQVLKVGTQPISLQLGGRYYADTTRRPRLGDSRRHHLAVSEMRARCGRATRARGPVPAPQHAAASYHNVFRALADDEAERRGWV